MLTVDPVQTWHLWSTLGFYDPPEMVWWKWDVW